MTSAARATTRPASGRLPDFDQLWDYNEPAATEGRFRELLPAARAGAARAAAARGPAERSYLIQLLAQIARAQGLQRKFDEAHATLDEVAGMLGDGEEPDLRTARVRYLLERGRAFNSGGEPDRARPLFLEAWELARSAGDATIDHHAVDAAHMMAIVAPPDEALEWNQKALAHAEQSSEPRAKKWLGSLYNNIGWTYHDQGDHEKALGVFAKAVAWREERGQARETRIARWCVGRTLRSLGRVEEALGVQQELHHDLAGAGEEDGYVSEEVGECLLALGRAADARPHFARAHELLAADPWLAEKEPERIARLEKLGRGGLGKTEG